MTKYKITWEEFYSLCTKLFCKIDRLQYANCYPIPKNGLYVANLLKMPIITEPDMIRKDTLIIDDLIDSGKTLSLFPNNDKAVLFVKNNKESN